MGVLGKNEEYDKKQVNKLKNILPFLSINKCKQYFQEAQTKGSSDNSTSRAC